MTFTYALADFIDFRDKEACDRVRRITREEITRHPNSHFKISVIDEHKDLFAAFAIDMVREIKQALDEGRRFVCILPVGPVEQYPIAARLINQLRIPMHHVHTFNMDEYADENGNTAPADWAGSFQKAMFDTFFDLIDQDLRPPRHQIHFPTSGVLDHYYDLMQEVGGVDVCYGGIGWCGHIAFWESHLGHEFGDDLEGYMQAGARIVTLNPMTIMQNALHSFGGDWSLVPPQAASIGPREVMSARYRSFWLPYGTACPDVSWQRFIARLCAHGPVNTLVPGSILQTAPGDYIIVGAVANNIAIHMS
jgi:glucosamine-6-phosphate deaminase